MPKPVKIIQDTTKITVSMDVWLKILERIKGEMTRLDSFQNELE